MQEVNHPDLKLPEQSDVNIGKYGMMRLEFLKKHRRGTDTTLLTECKLNAHLAEVDSECRSMVETLTAELTKEQVINENLKESNHLLWVQEMNNRKASAEKTVVK